MNRCYPSAAAGVCCDRPSLRSLLRPPERWTAASGSRGPSYFSSFRPGGRPPSHPTGQLQFVGLSATHGPRRLWCTCRPERRAWGSFHIMCGQLLQHFFITYSLSEGRDDRSIRNTRYRTSHFGEAGDELPEGLPWLLPHCKEVGLHTVLLVSTGKVRHEPRTEFFPGVDLSRGEVHEPGPDWSRQGHMKICCHHSGVSTCCRDGGNIHLQELRRVRRSMVFFWQVRPELGWPGRRAKIIRKSGAAHTDQGDTRLGPGAHWCLWCSRSEVLIEVTTIDVLAARERPFQGYPGVLSHTPTVEFCPEVIGLSAPY
jgi:hypothetical protein